MSLSALKVKAQITATETVATSTGAAPKVDYSKGNCEFVPSDATLFYETKVTISATGSTTLDLSGALTNALKTATAFTTVYGFLVINHNTVSGDYVNVGGSSFATWLGASNDLVKVGPKGCLLVSSPVDGYGVTNSTGDVFTVAAPGSNNVVVTIIVVGK